MATPTIGRIVLYRLTSDEAAAVNKRRADAQECRADLAENGFVVHHGNPVLEGQVFPALVVRVWDGDLINIRVLLDGNDLLWVTSRRQGDDVGTWTWPERA